MDSGRSPENNSPQEIGRNSASFDDLVFLCIASLGVGSAGRGFILLSVSLCGIISVELVVVGLIPLSGV